MEKDKRMQSKRTKYMIKNGYEAITILDDLLMNEKDEDTVEKLRILRKDVAKIVNINGKIHSEKQE